MPSVLDRTRPPYHGMRRVLSTCVRSGVLIHLGEYSATVFTALGKEFCIRTVQTRGLHAVPPGLDSLPASNGVPRLLVGKGKANLFLDGDPIVFRQAINSVQGDPLTGDRVVVADWKNSAIGWGIYNSKSLFACRILQLDREVRAHPEVALNVPKLLEQRITAATKLREHLGLPCSGTNVYRLINSEGDRLSGLVADVLADHAVIISSSLWTEQHSNTICDLLRSKTGIHKLVWRTDHRMLLAEYGVGLRENKGVDNIMPPPATAEAPLGSDSEDAKRLEVVIVEEGVKYVANPHGQKSGFYADQRDNRVFLRQCVKGKKVLDLCCYSGGFALNAAMHGAAEVLGVDSAPAAIELAKRNAALNGVLDKCSFECSKIEAFLQRYADSNVGPWDVVILDPPKLAPSAGHLERALRKYAALNEAAMHALAPGGLLMTCSCSGAIAQDPGELLLKTVTQAARRLRRPVTVLRRGGAAADHVVDPFHRHGVYLTNLLVRVSGP